MCARSLAILMGHENQKGGPWGTVSPGDSRGCKELLQDGEPNGLPEPRPGCASKVEGRAHTGLETWWLESVEYL